MVGVWGENVDSEGIMWVVLGGLCWDCATKMENFTIHHSQKIRV